MTPRLSTSGDRAGPSCISRRTRSGRGARSIVTRRLLDLILCKVWLNSCAAFLHFFMSLLPLTFASAAIFPSLNTLCFRRPHVRSRQHAPLHPNREGAGPNGQERWFRRLGRAVRTSPNFTAHFLLRMTCRTSPNFTAHFLLRMTFRAQVPHR
jgi:hypothetical protein